MVSHLSPYIIKLPLLVHTVIESLAATSFLLAPQEQLPGASEEARLIMRNYGGLLVATNWMSLLLFVRPGFDDTARLVTACLASYHIWPLMRAWTRLRKELGTKGKQGAVLGGPAVHLGVHIVLGAAMLGMVWWVPKEV